MAVFRVQKTQNYTIMSNHHLRNKALSLQGEGAFIFDAVSARRLGLYHARAGVHLQRGRGQRVPPCAELVVIRPPQLRDKKRSDAWYVIMVAPEQDEPSQINQNRQSLNGKKKPCASGRKVSTL